MKQFMFLYKGDPTNLSPADQEAEMEAWTAWIDDCGDAIIDAGSPMGHGISLFDDGSEEEADDTTGYSIVQAQNFAEAKRLTINHPHLASGEGDGDYAIEIHEIFPLNL